MSNEHKYHAVQIPNRYFLGYPIYGVFDESGGRHLIDIPDKHLVAYRNAVAQYNAETTANHCLEIRDIALGADVNGEIHFDDDCDAHYSLWICPDCHVDLSPFWNMLK